MNCLRGIRLQAQRCRQRPRSGRWWRPARACARVVLRAREERWALQAWLGQRRAARAQPRRGPLRWAPAPLAERWRQRHSTSSRSAARVPSTPDHSAPDRDVRWLPLFASSLRWLRAPTLPSYRSLLGCCSPRLQPRQSSPGSRQLQKPSANTRFVDTRGSIPSRGCRPLGDQLQDSSLGEYWASFDATRRK